MSHVSKMARLGLVLAGLLGGPPLAALEAELVSGLPFSAGDAANGATSSRPSADGRFVALTSGANNLTLAGDVNGATDVYLLDLEQGTRRLISHRAGQPERTAGGASRACCLSADGRFLLFSSDAGDVEGVASTPSNVTQVYLFDRESDETTLVSHRLGEPKTGADDDSLPARLSADGRYVVFTSYATDLIDGSDEPSPTEDLFLFDRTTGSVRLIDHQAGSPDTYADGSSFAIGFSADGGLLAISSSSTQLVAGIADQPFTTDVFLYDLAADSFEIATRLPGQATAAGGTGHGISGDGRYLLVTSAAALVSGMTDTNGIGSDCFLWDRQTATFQLVSRSTIAPLRGGNGHSSCSGLSADAQRVAFSSTATDFFPLLTDNTPAETDVFLFDRSSAGIRLASHAAGDSLRTGNGASESVAISGDGRFLLYFSRSTDLEAGITDTNGVHDLFRYDLGADRSTLVSRIGGTTSAGGFDLFDRGMMDVAGAVYFQSAGRLDSAATDSNGVEDAFHFDGDAPRLLSAAGPRGRSATGAAVRWTLSGGGRYFLWDGWLTDRRTGVTELVAHRAGSPAAPANGASYTPAISGDGRYLLVETAATDLQASVVDANGAIDLYLYDRDNRQATLISHAAGAPATAARGASAAAALSADGQRILFSSDAGDLMAGGSAGAGNLYLLDRGTGQLGRISHAHASAAQPANGNTTFVGLSANENLVLMGSQATDLVPGFVNNSGTADDYFLYDRSAGRASLINRQAGAGNPTLPGQSSRPIPNGDWSFFYFTSVTSAASTQIHRWNRATGQTEQILTLGACPFFNVSLSGMSADGRYLLLSGSCALVPSDTNGGLDVYVYDRLAGSFELASHVPGNPSVAAGGLAAGMTADGRFVLIERVDLGIDRKAYLYDRRTGQTTPLLRDFLDGETVLTARYPRFAADGRLVVTGSISPAVAPYDANSRLDVFAIDLGSAFADGFESGSTGSWSLTVP